MGIESLKIDPLYENKLDMQAFARMLASPTQSYKFYWLEAILTLAKDGDEFGFEDVFYEMLWEAWFTVTKYHLHLGPVTHGNSENYIEHAIHIIESDSDIKLPMTKEQFMYLVAKNRGRIKPDVDGLAVYVPYRLLSSFIPEIRSDDKIWNQKKRLISYFEYTNQKTRLPYTIIDGGGISKRIHIDDAWKQVLMDNYAIIKSWIQMKKIRFLQDRNPSVPGIVYKLEDEIENKRKLEKVRALWITYATVSHKRLIDIYSEDFIEEDQLSIDHFIPWSYVASDETWNLTPMDKSNNSSKGNKLPSWNHYFRKFANMQYDLYETVYRDDTLRGAFIACKTSNLNAIWAIDSLYVPGNSKERFEGILEENMKPIYDSAMLQGYKTWDR